MKKTKFKILLALVIISIFTIGMPIIAYGANENAVIVKQSDDEFLIYLKGLLNEDFEFAFSNDKNVTPDETEFISFAKDTANGANNIAYVDKSSVGKFVNKTYLWVKTNEQMKISGLEIDINDNITKIELENMSKVSTIIPVTLEEKDLEARKVTDATTGDKYTLTTRVGVAVLQKDILNGKYQLIKEKSSREYENLYSLADLLQKNEFTDKYTKIKASKEFLDLATKLHSELKEENWKTVSEKMVYQPEDTKTGDKFILWLKGDKIEDVHFLESKMEETPKYEKEKTILPYTFDDNTILIVLAIVVVAIAVVIVRIMILKKKEMNK